MHSTRKFSRSPWPRSPLACPRLLLKRSTHVVGGWLPRQAAPGSPSPHPPSPRPPFVADHLDASVARRYQLSQILTESFRQGGGGAGANKKSANKAAQAAAEEAEANKGMDHGKSLEELLADEPEESGDRNEFWGMCTPPARSPRLLAWMSSLSQHYPHTHNTTCACLYPEWSQALKADYKSGRKQVDAPLLARKKQPGADLPKVLTHR